MELISTDGVNWSASGDMPISYVYGSVVYGNGVYVAYGYLSPYAVYSTDGINSIAAENAIFIGQPFCVLFGNGVFVAYGPASPHAVYSTDVNESMNT